MSKLVAIMSMSLDGYVADPKDGVAEVFEWYFKSGEVAFDAGGADPMTFTVSPPSAVHLRALWSELGAVLTGRRTFDVAQGWNGNHAWGPAFVLTHQIPAGWPRPDSTVHFVTDGLESAVRQAKAAAGEKSVGSLKRGTQVEIVAWRPLGSNGTRYQVRSPLTGVEGWLGVANICGVSSPLPTRASGRTRS